MAEIPADVLLAARQAASEFYKDRSRTFATAAIGGMIDDSGPIQAAAIAIMAERERFMNEFEGAADGGIDAAIEAERERCARIAESYLSHGDKISQRKEIANRIRSSQP